VAVIKRVIGVGLRLAKKVVPAPVREPMQRALFSVLPTSLTTSLKEAAELDYWQRRKDSEGELSHDHYEFFYTTHFGLSRADYSGKRIIDIGCGPRGSLEWADTARERVGLDPLAEQYLKLGAAKHKMKYVASSVEEIPFADEHFDKVFSFNSLDHVEDLEKALAEIKRITKIGGLFLLLTDVNHQPTPTEPQNFSWDIINKLLPHFEVLEEKRYEKGAAGMYQSIEEAIPYDMLDSTARYGILSAKLRRLK
jgi:ubiquinone/menaquinone biosynthesis C-methylase UbiE